MATFLTTEWVDELAARAATVAIDADLSLTLEYRIIGEPGVTWHVELGEGRIRVTGAPHAAPVLTLTSSRAVAQAIQSSRLSAQSAFLAGDLRIGGEISRLIELRAALDAVAEALTAST